MKKIAIIGIGILFFSSSCKKNYNCECRNSFGTYPSGEVYGTKKKAEKKCKALSTTDTKCYVK